jgi:hypothetical protein
MNGVRAAATSIGSPIHITVTDRRATLCDVVNTADNRRLAGVYEREVPDVVSVATLSRSLRQESVSTRNVQVEAV